jgi:hypothetical protein
VRDNEEDSDTGLTTPAPDFKGISHISFCFDYEVAVTKDAQTTFTRTFGWTINKSVTPANWDLFTGDSGTSQYTVSVTKDNGTDSDWAVAGTITIYNPAPFAATLTGVSDTVSPSIAASVDCGVTFPYSLAAGGTLTCSYSANLPNGANRTNTATVTTSGDVGGGSGTAAVTFGAPTTVVNDSVTVNDSFAGNLGSFNASGSATYTRTFTCDANEGTHQNTATIVETNQSASASVTVNCYALQVTKNAHTSLTRTWAWTIQKSADQTSLLLSDGQLFPVNYSVTVDATSTDSDHAVSGDIWIANPNPSSDAMLTTVFDVVSPNIAANVNCPSLTVPAGGSLHCTYSADLPDDAGRINTASTSLQNHSYDSDGNATPSGTTDFSGSTAVSFANAAVTEVDECVDVNDTNVGVLGTVCAADAPHTFNYSLNFGKHPDADVQLECGENSHTNVASFVTNDTGATGQDDWTVHAQVACDQGCTLTPGYWKTHSHHGPAPEDTAWFLLGDVDGDGNSEGADETFFLSGTTYYQVLWTPPQGNAYYILAHAYIAAKLNKLNGAASTTQVDAALAWSTSFFNTYMPSSSLSKSVRNQAISKAQVLDDYNNGLIGPGHCSE